MTAEAMPVCSSESGTGGETPVSFLFSCKFELRAVRESASALTNGYPPAYDPLSGAKLRSYSAQLVRQQLFDTVLIDVLRYQTCMRDGNAALAIDQEGGGERLD